MLWGDCRPGGAEDNDHARERRLGAGAHVQGLDGEPHRVRAKHRNSSRVQAAKSAVAADGQVIFIVSAPRCIDLDTALGRSPLSRLMHESG